MHELAHVINRGFKGYLPFWEDKIPETLSEYPFLQISWKLKKEESKDRKLERKKYEKSFKDVWFYAPVEKRLKNEVILETYQKLQKTKLPSLYGVINTWDDFAEAFAIYHHLKILKKPYRIEVTKDKKKYTFKSCIETGRCPKKTKLIKELFREKLK